ncbi:ATP-binding cassette domain-containing protein [Flavobacterium zepuense]|uniref:ATP-binding cassette domain-containing protein n=1 Tax=Flavobacterium zepuense TaxID=2593302 RepID=A0A552V5V2_9FLAO|nr:ATP-binding cassette domain-containing protein [Flavobacterium zepuense]TRW25865.1 ATP-binding cassette domain-containing protein [Flavobacterium zepuense]
MNTLTITQLTKSFKGKVVLDNAGLRCTTSDILSIFGSNGSGKSTLLKILFGTEKADSVRIQFNDVYVAAKHIIPKQIIGYLPQDPFIPKALKVRDVIPLYFKGDLQDKIFYADGIHKMTNTQVGKLSMGELRYLELLLVGNLNHSFLMLDEPFSMVEPLFKEKIKEFLITLSANKGIIVTDHYYRDVLSISNKNLLLKNAQLIPVNTESELAALGYLPTSQNISI